MKTKKIFYNKRNLDHSLTKVEGAQVNPFVATRQVKLEKSSYWIVDHIQTGGKICFCDTYTEARKIGIAFTQACSKPHSTDPNEVVSCTDTRFKEFLDDEKYKRFEDFTSYLNTLNFLTTP